MLSSITNVKRTSNSNSRPTPPPYHIDITCVADRSGSMSTMGDSVINSVIEFVDSQKKSNHNNCSFHLCSFDLNFMKFISITSMISILIINNLRNI